ncbi:MAG: HAD-IA family hydrolase [Burkholderiaceae bacterium]
MTSISLIIFDWDGTVVDSTMTIAQAIQRSCEDLGLPQPSLEASKYVIGLGLQSALSHVAPELPKERIPELVDRFRHYYLARDQFLKPFEGVMGMLDWMHTLNTPLAVATGKSRKGLERALDATATRHYFAATRCADESDPKPSPTMVYELCDELDVDPTKALVIGDTSHDLEMAAAAGASAVAVTYGAHPREHLEAFNPLACLSSVPELDLWLRQRLNPSLAQQAG